MIVFPCQVYLAIYFVKFQLVFLILDPMSFGAVVAMTLIGCILLGILICNIPILLEPVASLLVPFPYGVPIC